MKSNQGFRVEGLLSIRDTETGEVVLTATNDAHPENIAEAMALSLAHRGRGYIYQMVFGNGASITTGTGEIAYYPPNIVGNTSQLYNQTFAKIVDDLSPTNLDPVNNRLEMIHVNNKTYADIVVYCRLDFNEPTDQQAFDDTVDAENAYVFDEIGLKSYDPTGSPRLLTHCMFHPFQKALNRSYDIEYTVRIYLG